MFALTIMIITTAPVGGTDYISVTVQIAIVHYGTIAEILRHPLRLRLRLPIHLHPLPLRHRQPHQVRRPQLQDQYVSIPITASSTQKDEIVIITMIILRNAALTTTLIFKAIGFAVLAEEDRLMLRVTI